MYTAVLPTTLEQKTIPAAKKNPDKNPIYVGNFHAQKHQYKSVSGSTGTNLLATMTSVESAKVAVPNQCKFQCKCQVENT